MSEAKEGDKVTIHFKGKTAEGDEFASSEGADPITFSIGSNELMPALEQAVVGMKTGDSKSVELTPEDGFGDPKEDLIIKVERTQFPEDLELAPGVQLQMQQPDGNTALVFVLEVGEAEVTLDANHPLAGQTVIFDIELVENAGQ